MFVVNGRRKYRGRIRRVLMGMYPASEEGDEEEDEWTREWFYRVVFPDGDKVWTLSDHLRPLRRSAVRPTRPASAKPESRGNFSRGRQLQPVQRSTVEAEEKGGKEVVPAYPPGTPVKVRVEEGGRWHVAHVVEMKDDDEGGRSFSVRFPDGDVQVGFQATDIKPRRKTT